MKPTTLFYTFILPLLVGAAPEPEALAEPLPLPSPEPQWQAAGALIPLIGGAFLLGALEQYRENTQRCNCPNMQTRCEGTACECGNQAAISCWLGKGGKCAVQIQNCPGPNGRGVGVPTNPNGEFPPCGGNYNACLAPRTCKKVDANCNDWLNQGKCLGICIPMPAAAPKQPQQPKQGGWGGRGPQQPQQNGQLARGGRCPDSLSCPKDYVCSADPRRAGSYTCLSTSNDGICGGVKGDRCKNDGLCVQDPRLNCNGFGCTGLCA